MLQNDIFCNNFLQNVLNLEPFFSGNLEGLNDV